MSTWEMILLLVGVIVVAIAVDRPYRSWRRRKFFAGRESLSHREFGVKYFPTSPGVAWRMRLMLEEEMGVDMSQVEPADKLTHECLLGTYLNPDDYVESVEYAFGITFPEADLGEVRTFEDLVQLVIRCIVDKYAGIPPMEEAWQRLEAWMAANAPELLRSLRGPVSDQDIIEAELAMGIALPADVKESYRRHDGQWSDAPGVVYGGQLLSLEGIKKQWEHRTPPFTVDDCVDCGAGPLRPKPASFCELMTGLASDLESGEYTYPGSWRDF